MFDKMRAKMSLKASAVVSDAVKKDVSKTLDACEPAITLLVGAVIFILACKTGTGVSSVHAGTPVVVNNYIQMPKG